MQRILIENHTAFVQQITTINLIVEDMSVQVSTCTSYDFKALKPRAWKLWCWNDVFLCCVAEM